MHIRKNFHSDFGRFHRLLNIARQFRAGSLVLTKEEELPAHFLGLLLQSNARMSSAFQGSSSDNPFIMYPQGLFVDNWRFILEEAIALQGKAALHRLWNGGLADAGLHNLFLASDRVWLFDISDPTLQTLPAFLTKFLFSFFHNLGMVNDPATGRWVCRFVPSGGRLALTHETEALLPKIYSAFNITLDRFIQVLFHGEETVRHLLLKYVVLQLSSDASFCLERWTIKGGGKSRDNNHNKRIEHWLWRALWDIYIAMDVTITNRHLFLLKQNDLSSSHSTSFNK